MMIMPPQKGDVAAIVILACFIIGPILYFSGHTWLHMAVGGFLGVVTVAALWIKK